MAKQLAMKTNTTMKSLTIACKHYFIRLLVNDSMLLVCLKVSTIWLKRDMNYSKCRANTALLRIIS